MVFSTDLPDPALFGLIPETTLIEVWSTFDATVAPQKSEVIVRAETNAVLRAVMAEPDMADTTLDFGSVQLIPGKAFPLNASTANPRPGADLPDSVRVFKRWQQINQRDTLVEQVEYSAVQQNLKNLPASSLKLDADTAALFVSDGTVCTWGLNNNGQCDGHRADLSGIERQAERPCGARAGAECIADRLRVRDGAADECGRSKRVVP